MQLQTKLDAENVVRKAFEAYNRHDLNAYFALFDPNVVIHDPFTRAPVTGSEVSRKLNEALLKACPDIEFRILNLATQGDLVAVEVNGGATFKDPLDFPQGTIPPTGRRFEYSYAAFYRINRKGLIVEVHNYYDASGLRQQLGIKA